MNPVYLSTGEGRAEALWRTYITNRTIYPDEPASGEQKWAFWTIVAILVKEPLDIKSKGGDDFNELIDAYENLQKLDSTNPLPSIAEIEDLYGTQCTHHQTKGLLWLEPFSGAARRYSNVRSPYLTENGYLGLGQGPMQLGDEAWEAP
ncbi:hypothetical protein N7463_002438 [Penicillium fimorum]|uniref:Uncharacterized protein n=1 Tax=Penicillium fimorum TaxID=1882269 RepID=A0A9X0C8I1_9EURO|nr:hypothetical protein N7463_002438 [Penicillium fimorum]